jgi:hypothetical protein
MELRSPNPEPDGSRRAGQPTCAWQRVATFALVFDRCSRVVPEARRLRADWEYGNREARPGLT